MNYGDLAGQCEASSKHTNSERSNKRGTTEASQRRSIAITNIILLSTKACYLFYTFSSHVAISQQCVQQVHSFSGGNPKQSE